MSAQDIIKLLQFRAAYNLPVHAGMEQGIFASHGLALEIAYTPGSLFLSQALRQGQCHIGHTGADDIVADVEGEANSDLFMFMGLHGGLFSLVGAPHCPSVGALRGKTIAVDAKSSGFVFVLEKMLLDRGFTRDAYQLSEVGGWESRYRALVDGQAAATLLTEPFIANALAAGCHRLARDFEMIPAYQGTCGAASRRWAKQHPGRLARYIRAYLEATRWCFDRRHRQACLDILTRHNQIHGAAAEHTLDTLLDPAHGLSPGAELNLAGVTAVLELRAALGYLARPVPPVEKYVDGSYYQDALAIGGSLPKN